MKYKIILLCILVFISGCLSSREHLFIEANRSGILEVEMKIPLGTTKLIDTMMGGMIQAMMEGLGSDEKASPPESISEQMFGDKEEIQKKADSAQAQIEFLHFNKVKKFDGIYVDYKIKFDNIDKFLKAEILSTSINLDNDRNGNWICEIKRDPEKAEESKLKVNQIDDFKNSEDFNQLDPELKNMILSSMKELNIEFFLTLPYEIRESTGWFKKIDSHTVKLEFNGDLFQDTTVIEKLYGMVDSESKVIWAVDKPQSIVNVSEKETLQLKPMMTDRVRIYLENGNRVEGMLLEKNNDYMKVDVEGVVITFYQEEIQNSENIIE